MSMLVMEEGYGLKTDRCWRIGRRWGGAEAPYSGVVLEAFAEC